jgi:hypothetical protein
MKPTSISRNFFYILLLPVFFSCEKGPDCEGSYEDHYEGINYGYIPFNDTINYWVPAVPDSIITFKTSNGFTGVYHLSIVDTISSKSVINSVNRSNSECDNKKEIVDDYAFPQSLALFYKPVKNTFPIIIKMYKKMNPAFLPPAFSPTGHYDMFDFIIADTKFPFSANGDHIQYYKSSFLPKVLLNGATFTNVYQIIFDGYSGGMTQAILLTDVYFQPGVGVVGFRFSNDEVWAKQ